MKGFQVTSGVCLIIFGLVSLQTQLISAAYTMSETCAYISKGYIADPSDCRGYGYCDKGVLVGTKLCDPGFLFDTTSGSCNYAEKVKCATKLPTTCKNVDSPVYVANPDDCTQACYCNGKGTYTCEKCPANQVFNPNTRSCVWSNTYECPANSICRLVPNNVFAGDPNKCGNYLACFDGSGVSSPCPTPGLLFDPLTGECQKKDICAAPVDPSKPEVGPGVLKPLPPNKESCSAYPRDGNKEYFVSDGKTCMGYYVCENAEGPGTWLKCPLGTHFNQEKQMCVTPYTFKCRWDRCGNIAQTFVSEIGCLSYRYCINQTTQPHMENSCVNVNQNFQYFNEVTGSCTEVMPDYEICKA